MVNPGGESTMLGQWRIVLRQAEEAARIGRYQEAYALANRPDVADHHQVVQLRNKMALDLIARGVRRAAADDLAGAIEDLDLAEQMGAPPDSLAAARLSLADRVAEEVRVDLESGEPARTLERIEELARHKISGPALRRSREIAEAWQSALSEGRRGEFGRAQEQLDRAERLAAGAGAVRTRDAVAAAKTDLENRQKSAAPRVESLYSALSENKWPQILAAAEAVLTLVPEHPAARQARTRAWQQIAAISPSASAQLPLREARIAPISDQEPARPAASENSGIVWLGQALNRVAGLRAPQGAANGPDRPGTPTPRRPSNTRSPVASRPPSSPDSTASSGRFLLWVDAVGGYLVCMDDKIVLGRAGSDSPADVPLMGDLSRTHATLIRNGEGYLLHAHHASFVNGKPVLDQVLLRDGDLIRLGSTVELEFRQPSPVSATARLAIVSRHRLPLAVDGVLLMAETCIIGAVPQAHIPAPALREPVVLYRQAGSLWCRASGAFDVDGHTCAARAPLTLQSNVLGDGFSFSLEPLENRSV
jgi:hypothetical protein